MRRTTKPGKRTNKGFFPIYPAAKITRVEWPTGTDAPYGALKVDSLIEDGLWYWAMEAMEHGILKRFLMHPNQHFTFKVDGQGRIKYTPDYVFVTNSNVLEQFCQFEQWDAPPEARELLYRKTFLNGEPYVHTHHGKERIYLVEAKGSWVFAKGSVMKPFLDKQIHLREKGVPINLIFPEPYEKNKRKYSGFYQQTFCPTALATKFGGKQHTASFKKSAGTVEDMISRNVNRTMVAVTENTIPKCELGAKESNQYLVSNWIDGTIMFYSPDHRYYHKLGAKKGEEWVDVRERHGWGNQSGPDTHGRPSSFLQRLAEKDNLLMSKGNGYVRIERVR